MEFILKVMSKSDAKSKGFKLYFTGKPCARGHVDQRRVSSSNCLGCIADDKVKASKASRAWKDKKKLDPEYMLATREKAKTYSASYHQRNRATCLEKMKARNKEYYQNNKSKIIASVAAYVKNNKDKVLKYKSEWQRNKLATDSGYKMAAASRRMLHRILGVSGQEKSLQTAEVVGYSGDCLVRRLESLFADGMCWANYGEWHIDHIKPIKAFIDDGVSDPKVINALLNLQPLWARDNMSKGSRYE